MRREARGQDSQRARQPIGDVLSVVSGQFSVRIGAHLTHLVMNPLPPQVWAERVYLAIEERI